MRRLLLSLFFLTFLQQTASADAWIDPGLEKFRRSPSAAARIPVIVMLEVPDVQVALPYRYDSTGVINYLKQITTVALKRLPADLQAGADPDTRLMEVYWINLSFLANVSPKGLAELAYTPGVAKIYAVREVHYPAVWRKPVVQGDVPYNVVDTKLDQLIKERGDVDGRGVLIGHIDTGVDGKHPALSGKVHLFFDGQKIAEPTDSDQHGTHTAGTLLGGDRQANLIGMAPAAKLISAGFLSGYDEVLRGMQWMLDPDGNPQTKDLPRMVSNSWNVEGAPDIELFYRAIGSWEAAGILPVFSAGNQGPRPRSITKPHEHPLVLAIAATGPDGKIASFSSRGPAIYKGTEVPKPDISAPGVNIISSIPGGGYQKFSGTSMACPHVAGAVALVLQVNPNLNPAQIRELMKASSNPVDENGQPINPRVWNPVYGNGKLNIYQAVKMASRLIRGASLPKILELPMPFYKTAAPEEKQKFKMVGLNNEGSLR